jgi:signal peptidase II
MRLGLGLAAVVLVLDQLSKWYVVEVLMRPDEMAETPFYTPRAIEILPFLDIVMAWNRGVSFGVFNNDSPYNAVLLSALSLAICAGLLVWLARTRDTWLRVALGLIVGGALGNVIDRIRWGAVADFVDVHAGAWHWPAFNVADAGITVGAALLVADALFGQRKSHKNTA